MTAIFSISAMLTHTLPAWSADIDSGMPLSTSLLTLLVLALLGVIALQMHRQHRAKEGLERRYSQITHAARLALIGEITASVTHEVTQPLSAILSNVETAQLLLRREGTDRTIINEILADVRSDALRAHGIVQRLRPMLRTRDVRFEIVDLNALVSNVIMLIRPDAASHRVELTTELDPRMPLVSVDPIHLQQVLLNLLINAMHAMNDHGAGAKRLQVRTERRDTEFVQVSVLDTGAGIANENLPKVFESFFTTKSDGMGLGLSIAKSIIKAHGGAIWAENREDGGAAFMFTVPVKAQ
jgi:two-component system sensor kinase FixL